MISHVHVHYITECALNDGKKINYDHNFSEIDKKGNNNFDEMILQL